MNFSWHFLYTHIFNLSPNYPGAIGRTLLLAVIAQVLGVILGLFVGFARLSRIRVLRWLTAAYVWVFRAVPELVILTLLYTGLAAANIYKFQDMNLLGLSMSAGFQAAIVGLAVREAAYMGEIFRNGIQSVDRGQIEAARALGAKPADVLRKIVVPQAMRVIVPPLGNQFNIMLKVTSLASVIGVPELFQTTLTYSAQTFRVFELFIGLAINYMILTAAWSLIQSLIEARLSRHEADAGKPGPMARLRKLGDRELVKVQA